MSDSASLTRGAISRHLVSQTAPMILGIFCMMGVGLLDAYFIGQLGPDALAAVSFIFPVSVALSSLGVGVMVGVNSVVSRAIGAGDQERACARAAQGVLFAALIGLAIGGSLLFGHQALFRLLQAPDALMGLISDYIVPYAIGLPALLVAMGINGTLRAQGEAVKSSLLLILVALFNGVLDPLLIFGLGPFPELGVSGAGWATALAYGASMFIGWWLVSTSKLSPRFSNLGHGGLWIGMRDIGHVGGPAAFANAINPIGLAVLTALLASHGKDAVAAFGAAGRLQSFSVVPLLALSSSIGPIAGQNWGAEQHGRARQALDQACLFSIAYGLIVAATLVIFRDSMASLFTDDAAIAEQIAQYLLIAAWGFAGFGCLVVANGALNAVDEAGLALRVSLGRVLLLMIPLAWAGSIWIGPGAVYAGELIANVIGGGLAFWLARRRMSPAVDQDSTRELRPQPR